MCLMIPLSVGKWDRDGRYTYGDRPCNTYPSAVRISSTFFWARRYAIGLASPQNMTLIRVVSISQKLETR